MTPTALLTQAVPQRANHAHTETHEGDMPRLLPGGFHPSAKPYLRQAHSLDWTLAHWPDWHG